MESFFFSLFFRGQELVEEDIDWWSKYYASLSDYDKCGDYIERGYDKIIVCTYEIIVAFPWYFSSVSYELILVLPIFILLWKYVVAFIECSLPDKGGGGVICYRLASYLNLYTLTSVCIFSIPFSIQFPGC